MFAQITQFPSRHFSFSHGESDQASSSSNRFLFQQNYIRETAAKLLDIEGFTSFRFTKGVKNK
jgi:hypothetical protein